MSEEQILQIEQMAGFAEQQDAAQENPWESIPDNEDMPLADPPPSISTGELCTTLVTIGCSMVASRRGKHWELNPTEAQEWGGALGAALDKYFPDLAETSGVEVAAIMTTGMVLMGRLAEDKRIADAKEVKNTPAAQADPVTHPKQPDAPEFSGVDLSNVDAV